MDEAKALAQHQQQLLLQQHQQQQQMYLIQQQFQQQQQRQQHQQAAMARFPSNIDAHLFGTNNRPSYSNPNPNPNSINHPLHQQQWSPRPNPNPNSSPQQMLQQKMNRAQPPQPAPLATNQAELQMAYQDAWRVCHPDFKQPFSSLEDACERLLPYHVVADYEAEEDDRILESDTAGQTPSRSQQWDHNIAVKVAEFTATFEKQALAFSIINQKKSMGEFRSEERLMIEQALLQEEKRAFLELRSEIEREKANLRMAALQAEQARVELRAHADFIGRTPIRANARGSQASDLSMSHEMLEQDRGGNRDEMINGWAHSGSQREEREPSDDFLNDEGADHGDTTGMQDEWRQSGEFDLNTR